MGQEDWWTAGGGRRWWPRSGGRCADHRETGDRGGPRSPVEEDRRRACADGMRAGGCCACSCGGIAIDRAEEVGDEQIRFGGLGLWAVYCFMGLAVH